MLLQWSKALEVGHPIVDYDHKMLVNIANELHFAVTQKQDDGAVLRYLGQFATSIETHFKREEALFMDSDYPHKEKHCQNHRDIEKLVRGFAQAYEANAASVDIEKLMAFLQEWLVKHIGKLDKGYASYVLAVERKHRQYNRRSGFV